MSDVGKVVSIEKGNGKIISKDGQRLTWVGPLQKWTGIPFYLTGKDFYFTFGILLAKKEKVTLNSLYPGWKNSSEPILFARLNFP